MDINIFDFNLPEELIAQTPCEERSESRLLVMDGNELYDRHFYNIVDYFKAGDVLVLNDTRVLAARLFGIKEITFAKVEVLILDIKNDIAKALVGNAKVVKKGTVVSFGQGKLKAECVEVRPEGIRIFKLIYEGIFMEILDELGEMPLPPYIHESLEDKERYQTVYSKYDGSAAAPTAGLHFTDKILSELENMGVIITYLTLHVGLGTFRPVKTADILDHTMHAEEYTVSDATAMILNQAHQDNRRICAVGTTSVRTLETVYQRFGQFKACQGQSEIFIYPGYEFKAVDAMITNFHLPKSTLIMLVSAFTGLEETMNAYHHAIEEKYRFFSFGDSMFIKSKKVL